MTPKPGIVIESVSRSYSMGGGQVTALDAVDIDVAPGESIAIVGPSGSGKSTLLHLVAGLDRPTSGHIEVFGRRLWEMSERELTRMRATCLGYVFQDPHLLPGLTALENVIASRLPWRGRRDLAAEARELLAAVGLEGRAEHACKTPLNRCHRARSADRDARFQPAREHLADGVGSAARRHRLSLEHALRPAGATGRLCHIARAGRRSGTPELRERSRRRWHNPRPAGR